MTQTDVYSTQSSFPLPDVFSTALVEIFEHVQPSIVQVHTEGRGGGTGVIWNADGRILTNNHVVARGNANVQVLLSDGRKFDARVLHREPRLDLALLKVSGDALRALPLGDSSALRVGEWVFAIGHPWGQRWVITAGVVSRKSSVKIANDFTAEYIQSDVRLAPGNSGGPMLNAEGEVVGINAMIFGGDLSVAIPSNVVSTWLAGLTKRTRKLGVSVQVVELPTTTRQSLPDQQASGLLIVGIDAEREANDLLVGDVLLSIAGKGVQDAATLRNVLAQQTEANALPVTVLRAGVIQSFDAATYKVEQMT